MPVVPRAPRFRFALPTERVARDLLGWRLARVYASGERLTGRIVETEAYPPGDPASHAARGSTPRCGTMFARPGLAYVYFIYGVHWCLNVVSEPEGIGAAVLVRGEETPFAGKALAADRLSRDGAPALAVGDSESDLDMFEAVARTGGRSFWVANVADPGAFPAAGILAEPYAAGVNRLLESVLAGPATPFEGRPETPAAEQRTPSGNLPGETR